MSQQYEQPGESVQDIHEHVGQNGRATGKTVSAIEARAVVIAAEQAVRVAVERAREVTLRLERLGSGRHLAQELVALEAAIDQAWQEMRQAEQQYLAAQQESTSIARSDTAMRAEPAVSQESEAQSQAVERAEQTQQAERIEPIQQQEQGEHQEPLEQSEHVEPLVETPPPSSELSPQGVEQTAESIAPESAQPESELIVEPDVDPQHQQDEAGEEAIQQSSEDEPSSLNESLQPVESDELSTSGERASDDIYVDVQLIEQIERIDEEEEMIEMGAAMTAADVAAAAAAEAEAFAETSSARVREVRRLVVQAERILQQVREAVNRGVLTGDAAEATLYDAQRDVNYAHALLEEAEATEERARRAAMEAEAEAEVAEGMALATQGRFAHEDYRDAGEYVNEKSNQDDNEVDSEDTLEMPTLRLPSRYTQVTQVTQQTVSSNDSTHDAQNNRSIHDAQE